MLLERNFLDELEKLQLALDSAVAATSFEMSSDTRKECQCLNNMKTLA